MRDPAAVTLTRPFEMGLLDWPTGPVLLLNARAGIALAPEMVGAATAVQPERGLFFDLQRAGFDPVAALPDKSGFAAALVLVARQRADNEAMIALALERLTNGAPLVVCGAKGSGVEALAKAARDRGLVIEKASKNHAQVFWLPASPEARAAFSPAHADGAPGDLQTALGGFSRGEIDAGSRLLADSLPDDLRGAIADFGAGWGYLSIEIAARFSAVTSLALAESHAGALGAARINLASATVPVAFHWLDLTRETVPGAPFDAVVMNPPFHDALGNHAPQLGQAFIAAAARALKPGGRLLMVANRQLPYEDALDAAFRSHERIADDGRFKVIVARR